MKAVIGVMRSMSEAEAVARRLEERCGCDPERISLVDESALNGELDRAFDDLGVPDEDADNYVDELERGGALVAVLADDDAAEHVAQVMRAGAGDATGEQVFELRETIEEPVVTKHARVVEEVVVTKDETQRDETVRGTVRRTDVRVERSDR